MGNPTTYKNQKLTWTKVRQLAKYGSNTFQYGADGIRYRKNNTAGSSQIGVDPNTLTISRTLHLGKLKAVRAILKEKGMYGVIIDGNHRVAVARLLMMAVDVVIK